MDRNKRKPITKKLRFSVFKRDDFCCAYCGRKPPSVVLEVDHITPVCEGGSDDIFNLVTSCFDCNRGKGGEPLTSVPETVERRAEILAEKEEQIKALNRLLKSKRKREDKEIDHIEQIFSDSFDLVFSEKFRSSVRLFLQSLSVDQVELAMFKACSKKPYSHEDALSYFCGICWNQIRGR